MRIEGITLWLFGGVARFSGEFPSAGAELRVALAGPFVSLVLGVALLAAALLTPLPSAVDGVIHWLGYINLVLLAFNMLPALPLDGGRVLRAVLWWWRDDFVAATHAAAGLGRAFGQLLIVGGLALAILGGGVGGLWLALIGWFVLRAAEAEEAQAERTVMLGGMTVADVMVPDPVTVPADLPLDRFLHDVFLRSRYTAYPVLEGDARPGRVRDRMVPLDACVVLAPDDPLERGFEAVMGSPLRRGLVLHDGRLAGLLSATDLIRLVEARLPTTRERVAA
jgi:CBS domain-containing protein